MPLQLPFNASPPRTVQPLIGGQAHPDTTAANTATDAATVANACHHCHCRGSLQKAQPAAARGS